MWEGQKVARFNAKAVLREGDLEGGIATGSTKRKMTVSWKKRNVCISAYDTEVVLVFVPASFEFPKW